MKRVLEPGGENKNKTTKKSPGRYQQLDLFIKVLRLLCPNLTDASSRFLSLGWRLVVYLQPLPYQPLSLPASLVITLRFIA